MWGCLERGHRFTEWSYLRNIFLVEVHHAVWEAVSEVFLKFFWSAVPCIRKLWLLVFLFPFPFSFPFSFCSLLSEVFRKGLGGKQWCCLVSVLLMRNLFHQRRARPRDASFQIWWTDTGRWHPLLKVEETSWDSVPDGEGRSTVT